MHAHTIRAAAIATGLALLTASALTGCVPNVGQLVDQAAQAAASAAANAAANAGSGDDASSDSSSDTDPGDSSSSDASDSSSSDSSERPAATGSLPSTWPGDVPKPEGDIYQAIDYGQNSGWLVFVEVQSQQDYQDYAKEFSGWTPGIAASGAGASAMQFTNDDWLVQLSYSETGNDTDGPELDVVVEPTS